MDIIDLNGTGCTMTAFQQNDGDIVVITKGKECSHSIRIGGPGSGHRRPVSVFKALVNLAKEFDKYSDCERDCDAEEKDFSTIDTKISEQEAKQILSIAIKDFGIHSQFGMAAEECGELITVLNQYARGRKSKQDVITEIADVTIMMRQMAIIFGEQNVNNEIYRKIERLQQRIEKYENK